MVRDHAFDARAVLPSMKCYRKNGSDEAYEELGRLVADTLNEVLPKERWRPSPATQGTTPTSALNEVLPKER